LCPARDESGFSGLPGFTEHAELVFRGGPRDGESVVVNAEIFGIGRNPDNQLVVEDPSVSRRHARIVRRDDEYHITDLDSTNGSFVNDEKLTDQHQLANGDQVRLGAYDGVLVFRYFSPSARTIRVPVVRRADEDQGVRVDVRTRQVYLDGEALNPPLPRKEFDLLALLHSRRGEAVSRDEIASSVWPERIDGDVGNHEIEQCIHRVRSRIESDTSRPQHLITMRGFGYRLE
jgi:pSer/pThr/pTyr-binding forkhead associated (FHA) protein